MDDAHEAAPRRPLILGLDPGTKWLGWAFADLEHGTPVACGREPITNLGASTTAAALAVYWRAFLLGRDVALVYVEGAGGGPNPKITLTIAEYAGALVHACSRLWPAVPVERLPPAEWKWLVGLKGNADKAAVAQLATELGWTFDPGAFDASDAAMIARAGFIRNNDILERAGVGVEGDT